MRSRTSGAIRSRQKTQSKSDRKAKKRKNKSRPPPRERSRDLPCTPKDGGRLRPTTPAPDRESLTRYRDRRARFVPRRPDRGGLSPSAPRVARDRDSSPAWRSRLGSSIIPSGPAQLASSSSLALRAPRARSASLHRRHTPSSSKNRTDCLAFVLAAPRLVI
jgi:hypothetical protein